MNWKVLLFVVDKFIKSVFTLLLIVVMILWIVLCVESTRQITDVYNKHSRSRQEERRWISHLNQAAITPIFTRATLPRLYTVAILNVLIQEGIALAAIISLLCRLGRTFAVAVTLLTIVWFIEQYRISDFYHHIDSIDWQSSQIIVAIHLIHFLIIILGFLILMARHKYDRLGGQRPDDDDENQNQTKSRFVHLEPVKKMFNTESSNIFKRQCDWMRQTFNVKKATTTANKNLTRNSNGSLSSSSVHPKKKNSDADATTTDLPMPDIGGNQETV